MPYTNEQARRAIQRKQYEDIIQRMRIRQHKLCVEGVITYNLPYRTLWDYYSRNHDFMEIPLNPWYPYPGVPNAAQLPYEQRIPPTSLKYSLFDLVQDKEAYEDVKEQIRIEREQIRHRQDKREAMFRPWNLDTAEGLENWKRYFAFFIVPYESNIKTWEGFDFYGTKRYDPDEVEPKRAFYLDLIQDYRKHPERYEQQRMKQVSDYDNYELSCYMWNQDKNSPYYKAGKEILLKELEAAERQEQRAKYRGIDLADDYLMDVQEAIEKLDKMKAVSN